MESCMSVPSVDLNIQAKSFHTVDRLAQNGWWISNFRTGHSRIVKVIDDPIFNMSGNRMQLS